MISRGFARYTARMRASLLAAVFLPLLPACGSLPHADIRTRVEGPVRIDQISGTELTIANLGPGRLYHRSFNAQHQVTEYGHFAAGVRSEFSIAGVSEILVWPQQSGPTEIIVRIAGPEGGSVRVLPAPDAHPEPIRD